MRYLFLILLSLEAYAHQSSLSSGGSKVKWPLNTIQLSIFPSTSDMSQADQQNIIQDTINQWNGASAAQISVGSGSLNTLTFQSDFSEYGSGVVGITEVSYNSQGIIQKANIILNDEYTFHNVPGFYSSDEIYLGDVLSHEMGHFLGQSHSEVLDSTMFYSSFSGQSSLHSDDISGVRAKYNFNYGLISGYIKGGRNIGVMGVHVQAISRNSGEIISTYSDETGRFVIGGLNLNDTYYLYTSPMKNSAPMPAMFSNVRNEFCPGSFVGSFFQACGKVNEGFPLGITLTSAQRSRDVGVVTINCSLKSNETYNFEKIQPPFDPVTIFDYDVEQKLEKAFVGNFLTSNSGTWSAWDRLIVDLGNYDSSSGSRFLKLALTGRKFGNQLEYEIEVWKNGIQQSQTMYVRQDNNLMAVVPGVTPYFNTTETYEVDLETMVPLSNVVGDNEFEIRIRAQKLNVFYVTQLFAEYEQFSTNVHLPYLLQMSLWDSPSSGVYHPLNSTQVPLSDNASCLDAPFTYVQGKAKALPTPDDSQNSGPSPTCGTIEPPGKSGPGNGTLAVSLGFMLALMINELRKRSKKFLS